MHALLIGNSKYEYMPLVGPRTDVEKLHEVLQKLGYKVEKKLELAHFKDFENSLRKLSESVPKEGMKIMLFYYSGHGGHYQFPNDKYVTNFLVGTKNRFRS